MCQLGVGWSVGGWQLQIKCMIAAGYHTACAHQHSSVHHKLHDSVWCLPSRLSCVGVALQGNSSCPRCKHNRMSHYCWWNRCVAAGAAL